MLLAAVSPTQMGQSIVDGDRRGGAAVRQGLWDGARRLNQDADARVLVVTGAGEEAFCAGGDLKEMAQQALTVPPPDFAPQFGRNIEISKPTIAAVNGVAFPGGFVLA